MGGSINDFVNTEATSPIQQEGSIQNTQNMLGDDSIIQPLSVSFTCSDVFASFIIRSKQHPKWLTHRHLSLHACKYIE